MKPKKIALFASGSGTNAQNIMNYFSGNEMVEVDSLWANNPSAFALERARKMGVETFVFTKKQLQNSDFVVETLKKRDVNLIVLAGFLLLIPANLIQNFPIVNIHPALLPKYGGKGMYGINVHKAVVENRDKETGITIHFVNDEYDQGEVVFQEKTAVVPTDTPEDVARKVHEMEYRHFPKVIETVLLKI